MAHIQFDCRACFLLCQQNVIDKHTNRCLYETYSGLKNDVTGSNLPAAIRKIFRELVNVLSYDWGYE